MCRGHVLAPEREHVGDDEPDVGSRASGRVHQLGRLRQRRDHPRSHHGSELVRYPAAQDAVRSQASGRGGDECHGLYPVREQLRVPLGQGDDRHAAHRVADEYDVALRRHLLDHPRQVVTELFDGRVLTVGPFRTAVRALVVEGHSVLAAERLALEVPAVQVERVAVHEDQCRVVARPPFPWAYGVTSSTSACSTTPSLQVTSRRGECRAPSRSASAPPARRVCTTLRSTTTPVATAARPAAARPPRRTPSVVRSYGVPADSGAKRDCVGCSFGLPDPEPGLPAAHPGHDLVVDRAAPPGPVGRCGLALVTGPEQHDFVAGLRRRGASTTNWSMQIRPSTRPRSPATSTSAVDEACRGMPSPYPIGTSATRVGTLVV